MGGIDLKQTLTRKQEESYQCILNYTKEHGYPPTVVRYDLLWNDTGEVLCTEWCDAQ